MKYRKLRIAFSVTCGIACVLLVVLWVRSYWRLDKVYRTNTSTRYTSFTSDLGSIQFATMEPPPDIIVGWQYYGRVQTDDSPTSFRRWLIGEFYYRSFQVSFVVTFPFWFPVLLLASVAALPWIPRRFSLRTLLIATTLVAVVLGVIIYASR